jgi:hypothetical protein
VQDPPLRTARSKVAFGFDLDGRSDGNATAKTCRHENFTGVNGEPGVDNQMYRLLACRYGWRRNGVLDTFGNEERRNSGRGVVLIEITGITDPRHSPDVKVAFYRALDPFQIDNAGRILPHASYRIRHERRSTALRHDHLRQDPSTVYCIRLQWIWNCRTTRTVPMRKSTCATCDSSSI